MQYLCVGILWGVTTPFMKSGLQKAKSARERLPEDDIDNAKKTHCFQPLKQRLEVAVSKFLGIDARGIFDFQVLSSYGLNQLGSIVFMIVLGQNGKIQILN